MNVFTIKDLENLSGIKAHTIRIWEQRYHFLKPQRTETNIRTYSSHELKTILNIALLNKYGYKISHIDKMDETEMQKKILSLSDLQAQQERVINDLIQHLVDLKLYDFEQLLDSYIEPHGIEKTILQIIFPFLERIGILWLTNHINPAQEHLVTNIIRQKLIVGIDNIKLPQKPGVSALLFMPEAEHHELGLLFIQYLLKNKGIKVLYVGANVPLKDVEYVAKLKNPNFLYTHLTTVASNFSLEKFLNSYTSRLSNYNLIISGQVIQHYKKAVPANISFKKSLAEVMTYVNSL